MSSHYSADSLTDPQMCQVDFTRRVQHRAAMFRNEASWSRVTARAVAASEPREEGCGLAFQGAWRWHGV